ncbi:MAG: FlgD immunoglobulin-like domain containing protein [candidate division WOR-3 bacterium]
MRGIGLSKEYPPDIPLSYGAAEEDIYSFGLIQAKFARVVENNKNKKDKPDVLLRSVEEFLIDTNRVFVNAQGHQGYLSIAFDGTNYLVVWADGRDPASELWDIYCARCSPEGVLLDSSGILISSTTLLIGWDEPPFTGIGFDGTNYFVVWHDRRTQPDFYDIIGARVSQDGAVLDPDGILICPAPYMQSYPRIAFGGTNYMVVWHDYRNGNFDIYGARVNPSGIVLDPDGIAISTADRNQGAPAVAYDGINFLVVWEDWRNGNGDIYGSRVNQAGLVLDPDGIPISTTDALQSCPRITFGGFNYLVAWFDSRNTVDFDIYGARITPSGSVLDPNGIAISQAIYNQAYPVLSFDGNNYLVVWHDFRDLYTTYADIYCARVDQSGQVLDPAGIAISAERGGQGHPAIAFDGTNYLTVWHDNRSMYNGDGFDIYGARVTQTGVVLDPEGKLLSTQIYGQGSSAASFDGANFLVVWHDFRNGTYSDIYGARIGLTGEVLDPEGISISSDPYAQKNPSVAFDGNNYLVVWEGPLNNNFAIYGARVSRTGQVLDPNGILIFSSEFTLKAPKVIFGQENYLVVCEEEWHWGLHRDRIRGALVNTEGMVLTDFILDAPTDKENVSLSFDGTNFLIVFQEFRPTPVIDCGIYGVSVSQTGVILDPGGIPISIKEPDMPRYPSVSFDGTNYFVVWQDYRNAPGADIYGARVSPGGVVLDPDGIPIIRQPGDQVRPKASFNGSHFVVVWEDVSSGDLIGAKVSSAGMVSPIFSVSTSPGLQYGPAICHGAEDLTLVTFTGWVPEFENYRIWGKFIGEHALWTDDPLALAYNGERHLARKPGTQELHITYTNHDKVIYRRSSNGGTDWTIPFLVGEGGSPTIALDHNGLPSIIWTSSHGRGALFYRRKISSTEWSPIDTLYYSLLWINVGWPSMVITYHQEAEDTVHILCHFYQLANGRGSGIGELKFPISNPLKFPISNPDAITISEIEGWWGPMATGPWHDFPSITRCEIDNSLHAVWQRADTICYATRQIGQTWQNWGWQFDLEGLQSAHPFIETYGDSVFVLWQHQENGPEAFEVYRAGTYMPTLPPRFSWFNLSQSPNTKSLYPVNATGMFNVYVDEIVPPPDSRFEIFYRYPGGFLNISQTLTKSLYPHVSARVTGGWLYLYTAWLEGDDSPYEIGYKRLQFPTPQYIPAFLTSPNGIETPSSYLIQRDSFISTWQIPVDVGYGTITYRLPLAPGYRYKIKAIIYHESSGEWREWIKIDNKLKHLIKYNPYEPETLECWIPPAFYQDGWVEVVFDQITGLFATCGPIFVYRYEYEESEKLAGHSGSGKMSQDNQSLCKSSFVNAPNPFTEKTEIRYEIPDNSQRISLKIYDITGRLVKRFDYPTIQPSSQITWTGDDENGRPVSQGIYFLRIENLDTGESAVHKILRLK